MSLVRDSGPSVVGEEDKTTRIVEIVGVYCFTIFRDVTVNNQGVPL